MDKMVKFQKVIPITKAYEDEDGNLYLKGESSGPELDLDKQFMTTECIQGMAEQVNKSPIPYLDEHQKRGVASELGTVIGAEVTPEYHLKTTTKLDRENGNAVLLWKKVQKGKKFGQSVAGHVAELATKVVDGVVRKGFNRIILDHIANTTKPSWAPSLGTLVAKSLEDEGLNWDDAPAYEGDLPFSAEVVNKRSKPDPKAGKGYVLVEDLLKRLNTHFGWETYQDMIDESNRDKIPLTDNPAVKPLFPVGSIKPPTKAVEEDGAEWEDYIQKAMDMVDIKEQPGDIRSLAEIYERLHWIADSLMRRDERNSAKEHKKTITKLKAAMAAVTNAMKEVLSKSEAMDGAQPPPVTLPPPEVAQVPERILPANALKSFADVGDTADVPPDVQLQAMSQAQPQPEMSVAGGELASFSQVADTAEEQIAQRAAMPQQVIKTIRTFEDVVGNIFEAEAEPTDKQKVLLQVSKAFVAELHGQLEGQRPEEDRLADAVAKAQAPLLAELEAMRSEIALLKSEQAQPVTPAEGDAPLVRKSIPGGRVILQAARVVKSQEEAPTFEDLVRDPRGHYSGKAY